MSANMSPSEKAPILPVAETQPPAERVDEGDGHSLSRIISLSTVLLIFLILAINAVHILPASSPLVPYAAFFGSGLQTSAWGALPAPIIIFIYAPTLAQPGKVEQTRYLTFLFYLIGTCVGGIMFGVDLRDALLALRRVFDGTIIVEN